MSEIVKRKNSARGYALYFIGLLFSIIFFLSSSLNAQNGAISNVYNATLHHQEVIDDPYVPSPRDQHPISPAYKYAIPGFTIVQVNVNGLGANIIDDAGNEPSITFDPNDHNRMAIGWRQFDDINNNFRQAGNAFTTDGGETWIFPEVLQPGIFYSDPVLDCDREGNFYYNGLTYAGNDYWCNVFKSTDGGATYDEGVYAQGGDKQWMAIDKSGGIGDGNIYAFWNASFSICEPDFITRSVDDGLSYETCSSIPGYYPYWGTTEVSGDGELYMCGQTWGGSFAVSKSTTAQNDTLPMTWDFTTSVDLDGHVTSGQGDYSTPNPGGLLGQAYITIDSSGGPTHGNVYLLASVVRHSNPDPMDVMITRSEDGGLTWSDPIRVNNDLSFSNYNWMSTISVAPDGRLDVVWLDTRDNPGTVLSRLYYAYSLDAGNTWSENYPLSESFDPHVGWPQQDKMGDYFEMFSDENGAHLAWAATFNGEQDVYYSHISPAFTALNENRQSSSFALSQNFPNPATDQTTISYDLTKNGFVSLILFDIAGCEIATLVNAYKAEGRHHENFNTSNLAAGTYYYKLTFDNISDTKKLIIIK